MSRFSPIYALVSLLFPLLCGPVLLFGFSRAFPSRELFLAYLVFVLLVSAWHLLQNLVVRIGLKRIDTGAAVKFGWRGLAKPLIYLSALMLFVFVLGSLHYVRERFNTQYLYLVLAVLALASLKVFSRQKSLALLSLACALMYYCLLVFCGYYFLSGRPAWQVAVYAAACASMFSAADLLGEWWDLAGKGKLCNWRVRIYTLLSCLGPGLLVGLSIYGQLPQRYMLLVILIPLSTPTISRLRLLQMAELPPQETKREATGICALFFVMLLLLMLI